MGGLSSALSQVGQGGYGSGQAPPANQQPFQAGAGGSLSSSGTTLGEGVNAIGQTPYVNLVNADAQQTAALNRQAGAALQTRAPQVIDPSAAASRASLAGAKHGCGGG